METKRIRRQKLREVYGDTVRPLTKKQRTDVLKDTAHYIWFDNHDAFNGHCERCDRDVVFKTKTRHHKTIKCPKCRHEMVVRHKWRVSYTENIDFRIITKVMDDGEVFMRYILVDSWGHENYERHLSEVAREVINFDLQDRRTLEMTEYGWDECEKNWFKEFNMGWQPRRYCCLFAEPMPGLKDELKKLPQFKYLDDPTKYFMSHYCTSSEVRCLSKDTSLYEKLEKVGLTDLAVAEFIASLNLYRGQDRIVDPKQTSVVKALRLNKRNYRRLFSYPTLNGLEVLQRFPGINDEVFDFIRANTIKASEFDCIYKLKAGHLLKTLRYVTWNNIDVKDYADYVETLKELHYKLDKAYLFPKDFRKEDKRVQEEYRNKQEQIRQEKIAKRDGLIKQISDGLRGLEDLQKFMDGSKGLLVYVPENAIQLQEESKALHNCLSTYANRIAEGKTLVFFIRKLEAPNEPFIAMEYCNGEVIQVRYDHNEAVKDAKILDFVDAFAEKLRNNKVLCA